MLKRKFVEMLDECIEEILDEGRGRPKAKSSKDIESEFKAAKKDEKAINKLIMKYGEHDEDDVKKFKLEIKKIESKPKMTDKDSKQIEKLQDKINVYNVVKKYLKYQTKNAEDFISRPGATEREV